MNENAFFSARAHTTTSTPPVPALPSGDFVPSKFGPEHIPRGDIFLAQRLQRRKDSD
jgi:hypothetical protein